MSAAFTVRECLQGYTHNTLLSMCGAWGVCARTKEGCIRALEKVLGDPLHLRESLRDAHPDILRLLHILASRDVVTAADALAARGLYTESHPTGLLRSVVERGWTLIVPQGNAGAFSLSDLNREYRLPDSGPSMSVSEGVAAILPAPPEFRSLLTPIEGEVRPCPESAGDWATSAFLEVLRLVDVERPRVIASGAVHRADLARMQDQGREAGVPAETATVILGLARALECVVPREGRLVVSPRAEEWVRRPRADRTRDLFNAFQKGEDLVELQVFFPELVNAIEGYAAPGTLRRTYHKQLVALLIRSLEPSRWYAVRDFVDEVRRRDRNVLFLDEPWRAIQAHARGDLNAWKEHAWRTHEERLFEWMVRVVLAGLGIVELAEGGRAFRVTDMGRYALGEGPLPSAEHSDGPECRAQDIEGALVVQPDFEIIAFLDRCSLELRRRLDTFCERIRGGHAATYRLTDESVQRGVHSGMPLDGFVRVLEAASARPLPVNVRDQFATWARKLNAVVIWTGCRVIECANERDARHLAKSQPDLRLVGSRFLICQGPVPKTDAVVGYGDFHTACLDQEEGLRLRCPWTRSTLFTVRALEKLGKVERLPTGDLVLQLSPDMPAMEEDRRAVLAELERLARHALHPRYGAALKAWSEDGVAGKTRTSTLVRFDDAETAEAVFELPGVSEVIEGRLGAYTLAVKKGRLGALKRLLKPHGIRLINSDDVWDDDQTAAPVELPEDSGADATRPAKNRPKPGVKTRGRRKTRPAAGAPENDEESLPSYSPRILREILEDAIQRRRPVLITYESALSARACTRRIKPVTLDLHGPTPTLNAYCCRQNGPRQFKLSQIRGIRVLERESF